MPLQSINAVDYGRSKSQNCHNFQKENVMAITSTGFQAPAAKRRKLKFYARIILKYAVKLILHLILILLKDYLLDIFLNNLIKFIG